MKKLLKLTLVRFAIMALAACGQQSQNSKTADGGITPDEFKGIEQNGILGAWKVSNYAIRDLKKDLKSLESSNASKDKKRAFKKFVSAFKKNHKNISYYVKPHSFAFSQTCKHKGKKYMAFVEGNALVSANIVKIQETRSQEPPVKMPNGAVCEAKLELGTVYSFQAASKKRYRMKITKLNSVIEPIITVYPKE